MEHLEIKAELREKKGKELAKKLRAQGKLPAVLYGEGKDSVAIAVSLDDVKKVLRSKMGINTTLKLKYGKKVDDAMIYELQYDYLGREIIHVDFKRVDLNKPVEITVPIHLVGTPIGVKQEGGFLDFITREIDLICLPKDIIEEITVDVSELHAGQSLKVSDLDLDEKYKLLTDESVVIATVTTKAEEEEVEEEEEEVEGEEEKTEPEVEEKGKSEKEEE